MYVLGPMSNGAVISDETPVFEFDDILPDTKYIRYEDTTNAQYIKRILTLGGITKIEKAADVTWVNRATGTYKALTA